MLFSYEIIYWYSCTQLTETCDRDKFETAEIKLKKISLFTGQYPYSSLELEI